MAGVLAGCSTDAAKSLATRTPSTTASGTTNSIVLENAHAGNAGWRAPRNDRITGYTDAASVAGGGMINFAVSTTKGSFNLDIYRLGWYGGVGGRLMLSVEDVPGIDQGHWIGKTFGVAGCPTCEVDPSKGTVDANWAMTYSLIIPSSWTSGVYIARLSASGGDRGSIPFVVRADVAPSALLAVLPINTWQAYNAWGGKSLYASSAYGNATVAGDERAVQVSFNRPYGLTVPQPQDIEAVSFLERLGYEVTYATDVDLDRTPRILAGHRLYVAIGHDEYWSKDMRDSVEAARDHGLSLAFLGGNDVYWQARYEPDTAGHDRRTLVVYKSAQLDHNAATRPQTTTVIWADPPVNRPQNDLTGTLFRNGFPPTPQTWIVAAAAPDWFFHDTSLRPGDGVAGLVSGECDRAVDNAVAPPSLIVLGASVFTATNGSLTHCDTTWYVTSHNSAVFSAGDTRWADFLDGPQRSAAVVGLTRNVLDRLIETAQPYGF